jgi:hypothetical protein
MPLKVRIEEEAFQRALYALGKDQLCLLDSSSTTSAIWGFLCVLMNKADNIENRRACYDVWKRKRIKFQPIVDELLQRNTFKCTSDMSELNNETPVNIPVDVCKIVEINI